MGFWFWIPTQHCAQPATNAGEAPQLPSTSALTKESRTTWSHTLNPSLSPNTPQMNHWAVADQYLLLPSNTVINDQCDQCLSWCSPKAAPSHDKPREPCSEGVGSTRIQAGLSLYPTGTIQLFPSHLDWASGQISGPQVSRAGQQWCGEG